MNQRKQGAQSDAIAVTQYVKRALHARREQGLPAAIEDHETLDKLAVLMSAPSAHSPEAAGTDCDGTVTRLSADDRINLAHVDKSASPDPRRRRHRPNMRQPRPGPTQSGHPMFRAPLGKHVAGADTVLECGARYPADDNAATDHAAGGAL